MTVFACFAPYEFRLLRHGNEPFLNRGVVNSLINRKQDHLTPIGNLYLALESGPPTARVARVYPDHGHIAARNEREWAPAAWKWLAGELAPREAALQ